MTTVRAWCPDCGEVDMTSDDVLLMVCANRPALSYYTFDCPGCAVEVRKPACQHAIAMLVSGDVRTQVWAVPAEALEQKVGEPVSYDELLTFALELDADPRLAARLQPKP